MPVTAWRVVADGVEYAWEDGVIEPESLARAVAEAEGEEWVTSWGAPVVARAGDAESVHWWLLDKVLYGRGPDDTLRWDYAPDPPDPAVY